MFEINRHLKIACYRLTVTLRRDEVFLIKDVEQESPVPAIRWRFGFDRFADQLALRIYMRAHDRSLMSSVAKMVFVAMGENFSAKEGVAIQHLGLLVIGHFRDLIALRRSETHGDRWVPVVDEEQDRAAQEHCDRFAVDRCGIEAPMMEREFDRFPE